MVWSIGEVARQVGLAASTIRYYEAIRLLPPPVRVSGQRRYDQETIRLLEVIQIAKAAGYSLGEIRTLLADYQADRPPAGRWASLAQERLAEIDRQMSELQHQRAMIEETLACTCGSLLDCADAAMDRESCSHGVEP